MSQVLDVGHLFVQSPVYALMFFPVNDYTLPP